MSNTTKSKKKYVSQWFSYIEQLNTLGFCPDKALSDRVFKSVEDLKQLVYEIALSKGLR